jgi:kumamolisin
MKLAGSERKRRADASLLGPADPGEQATVTVILRRHADTGPTRDFAEWSRTPLASRQYLSAEEFGSRYGASPDDLAKVTSFASSRDQEKTKGCRGRR